MYVYIKNMTTWAQIVDIMTNSSEISDPRMDLPLMRSPMDLITILAIYFSTIKIGPKLMQTREPFSLKKVITVYNILQIIFNLYIFNTAVRSIHRMHPFLCLPCGEQLPDDDVFLSGHYQYILLKYFDLIETLFYILRKKNRQISFLHVYHHFGILTSAFISGKYFPGGPAIYVGFFNTFVHSIMYCYYLYASWYPGLNLWWKKYITLLQIVQHCMIFMCIFLSMIDPICTYPKKMGALFTLNVLVIIYLFGKFYKDNYLSKKKD